MVWDVSVQIKVLKFAFAYEAKGKWLFFNISSECGAISMDSSSQTVGKGLPGCLVAG